MNVKQESNKKFSGQVRSLILLVAIVSASESVHAYYDPLKAPGPVRGNNGRVQSRVNTRAGAPVRNQIPGAIAKPWPGGLAGAAEDGDTLELHQFFREHILEMLQQKDRRYAEADVFVVTTENTAPNVYHVEGFVDLGAIEIPFKADVNVQAPNQMLLALSRAQQKG